MVTSTCIGPQVDRPEKLVEVVGQKRLADKVTTILGRIEKELDEADTNIGNSMHVLDLDNDGLVRLSCYASMMAGQLALCTTFAALIELTAGALALDQACKHASCPRRQCSRCFSICARLSCPCPSHLQLLVPHVLTVSLSQLVCGMPESSLRHCLAV